MSYSVVAGSLLLEAEQPELKKARQLRTAFVPWAQKIVVRDPAR